MQTSLKKRSELSPKQIAAALILATAKRGSGYADFQERYFNDPVGFVKDCINWKKAGGEPSQYQLDILQNTPRSSRSSVRGPHGLGKTALAAWFILWFALTRDGQDWKAPTTASAWRQLTKFLWPEIHKWSRHLKWDLIGRPPFDERIELMSMSLRLRTGEAFALASDRSEFIEGAHADHLLYVFDEAKVIPPPTWDSAEGAFSTGEVMWLAISTPGSPNGRFYDIQSKKAGYEDWWVRHVTLDEAVAAGRITPAWAEQRARQWGEGSSIYKTRVLGEFSTEDEQSVIPLHLVEAAIERWHERKKLGTLEIEEFKCVGVDVARSGEDRTVLALRRGTTISEIRSYSKALTTATVGRVAGIVRAQKKGYAIVDVIGVGAGVYDQLREMDDVDAIAFSASGRTTRRDRTREFRFLNKRAAAWWLFREMLEDGEVALPDEDMLVGDLTAPHWKVSSLGRIQVESKDDIRKRIGRSTDYADAVIQAFWTEARGTGLI